MKCILYISSGLRVQETISSYILRCGVQEEKCRYNPLNRRKLSYKLTIGVEVEVPSSSTAINT